MKRQRRRLPHHRIWSLAALLPAWAGFVLLSGLPADGLVLCLGADGHVAVETARDGRCHGCEEEHGSPEAGPALSSTPASSACGACVDVELERQQARGAAGPRVEDWQPIVADAGGSALPWSSPRGQSPPSIAARAAERPPGLLAHLRTVILLT